jgi:exoribonuclease R
MTQNEILRYKKSLSKVASQCSSSEQKAEDVERKITHLKMIEYMEKFI